MKLLTKAIINKLPELYSTSELESSEVSIQFKLFDIRSNAVWLATEGKREGDDWLFFGWARIHEGMGELGYFKLSDFSSLGIRIERDRNYRATLEQAMDQYK